MGVWDFIQDQVLGMKWLNELLGIGLSALGLDVNGRIGGSVQFFIYDVLKITVLLCVLIFAISYIQSYFPPERSKRRGNPKFCVNTICGANRAKFIQGGSRENPAAAFSTT